MDENLYFIQEISREDSREGDNSKREASININQDSEIKVTEGTFNSTHDDIINEESLAQYYNDEVTISNLRQ
jgi:hypothetical protein